MKKTGKKLLSLFLTLIMVVGIAQVGSISANAKYSSSYKTWSQGASSYYVTNGGYMMRKFGCWVVADAKMLCEAGIITSSSFDPDVLLRYYKKNGHIDKRDNSLLKTGKGPAGPVDYAKSIGNNGLKYLGASSYSSKKLWDNINNGYYSIICVGGHYCFIANALSKQNKAIWVYDSSSQLTSCAPHKNSRSIKTIYTYSYSNTKPGKPSIWAEVNGKKVTAASNGNIDVPVNSTVTIKWNSVANAQNYNVYLDTKAQVTGTTSTSYSYKATDTSKKHEFDVRGRNPKYLSDMSNKLYILAHNDLNVTFDLGNGVTSTQKVKYGQSAVEPATPTKEGYTFTGWDKSLSNITSDQTITAKFKINEYSVKFLDSTGNTISLQKITHGNSAVEPEDKNVPANYNFIGWNTEEYKNVKENLTVRGIYAWGNVNIPIVQTGLTAVRQDDGYTVTVNLRNYPNGRTSGRAIVSLKTGSGRLVYSTESAAFSMPANGTKQIEVFLPTSASATVAEVVIVDKYPTGVPISAYAQTSIDQGLKWSDWVDSQPAQATGLEIESRNVYRYSDKKNTTVTNSSSNYTMSGWTKTGTTTNRSYGSWSNWSESKKTASATLDVATRSVYKYFHYCNKYNIAPSTKYTNGKYGPHILYYTTYKEPNRTSSTGYKIRDGLNNDAANVADGDIKCPYNIRDFYYDGKVTQYRSRSITTTYTHSFEQWTAWSDWSTTAATQTSTKNVQTKKQYRYRSDGSDIGTENDNAPLHNAVSVQLDPSYAGKQVTLFVYKVDEASDFTNEFVAQSTINNAGLVYFPAYKLREEPSVKTGDFTVAIGIEGANEIMVVDTLEAPKPEFTVIFEDEDGSVIKTETVQEGLAVQQPANPSKPGKIFVGWDNATTCINRFMVNDVDGQTIRIKARYIDEIYTVVFVNHTLDTVEVRQFNYGDTLTVPETETVVGYELTGWSDIIEGETIVTQNMVVTAQYEVFSYDVVFKDFDGNVISTQKVNYGEGAVLPEEPTIQFASFNGWEIESLDDDSITDLYAVTDNMTVVPTFIWDETCTAPSANVTSGTYENEIQVTLSCEDDSASIYYTLDGSNPNSSSNLYSGNPLTIKKSTELKFIACADGKNDSQIVTEVYAVNGVNSVSPWMIFDEIPQSVKDDLAHHDTKSAVGYRYKEYISTSDVSEANTLENGGYTFIDETYGEWSEWSISQPEIYNKYCEIEEKEADPVATPYYQYTHWKYLDAETDEYAYSNEEIEGTQGEWETISFANPLSVTSFIGSMPAYAYADANWFNQTVISKDIVPDYMLYRYRMVVKNYYKWTEWTTDVPGANETREYVSDTVFSYADPEYHVASIIVSADYFNDEISDENVVEKTLVIANETLPDNIFAIEGYDMVGYYTDADFTNAWDINTPITSDIVLYAKYEIKTFTVIFKLEDGAVLDTQTVEYNSPAAAPDITAPEGFVFVGWDKDFEVVTEDMTVTASILSEDEVIKINLNKSSIKLLADSYYKLSANLDLGNHTDDTVTWSSSNYDVADVDDSGYVYAVAPGTAVITATASDGMHASCTVTVYSTAPKFDITNENVYILINETEQIDGAFEESDEEDQVVTWSSSDTSVATVSETGEVRGVKAGSAVITATSMNGQYKDYCLIRVVGMTASAGAVINKESGLIYGLEPRIDSLDEYVSFNENGLSLEYDTTDNGFGTNTIANVVIDGQVVDSFTIVFFGDVNGDGVYDGQDALIVSCLASGLLTREQVGEAVYMAADCNHDGAIDAADVQLLEQAGVLLAQVDQSKSDEELSTDSAYIEYLELIDQNPNVEDVQPEPEQEQTQTQPWYIILVKQIIKYVKLILSIFTK